MAVSVIRPARLEERLELVALQRRAALANPGDRPFLQAHPAAIDTPKARFRAGNVLVAEGDGRPLGFAALYMREDGDAELDGLFVEPEAWRGGIGRALVEAALIRAAALGAARLSVVGNPHAKGFYLKLGFVLTGTFETQFGTGLLLEREIAAETG